MTDEEIRAIIDAFLNTVGRTQYIGARYVPTFGRLGEESVQWDGGIAEYEPLTIVLWQGDSFTSRKTVPVGTDILNEEYWANTGNFNGQLAQIYRRLMELENPVDYQPQIDALSQALTDEQLARSAADIDLQGAINEERTARDLADTELEVAIEAEQTARELADTGLNTRINATNNTVTLLSGELEVATDEIDALAARRQLVWIGDSWSTNFDGILPNTVAHMLGMELHNYGTSNAGWFEGNTFGTQIASAIADTALDPKRVGKVIIYGGTNDYSHDHTSATQFVTEIMARCADIANAFPLAEVHLFFNIRYAYGSRQYLKINPQIYLWKSVSEGIAASSATWKLVPHPESAYWPINRAAMQDDGVHPTEANYVRIGARVAQRVSGSAITVSRSLDVKEIELSAEGVSGRCYFRAENERIFFDYYLNVTSTISANIGLGVSVGMIPVEIFNNSTVGDARNRVCAAIGGNDTSNLAYCVCQMNRYDSGSDVIYLIAANGNSIATGHYSGHGEFIIFV